MMNGVTIALGSVLLAASAAAFAAPPSPNADVEACKNTCTSIEDETDRATCRLNCTQAGNDDRPSVTRWTEERSVGGPAPGQETAPPPVRTVTTVTPSGTTTTTNAPATTPSPTPSPRVRTTKTTVATPRAKYYFGLVDCQDRCNGQTADLERAQCKLKCLRRQPGPPPPRTTAKTPDLAPEGPVVAPALGEPIRPTPQPSAKTPKSDSSSSRMCYRTCAKERSSCEMGCSGEGSDASTCRLQCEQVGRLCSSDCGG